jgi:hypothetical protein
MQTAMLYNLPLLAGLYVLIASLHCAFPFKSNWIALLSPVVAVICGWIWSDAQGLSVAILSFVASGVYACVSKAIGTFQGSMTSWKPLRLVGACFGGVLLLLQILGILYSHMLDGSWSLQPLDSVLFLSCVGLVYMIPLLVVGFQPPSISGHRRVSRACLLLVITPCLVAGQIALIAWEGAPRASSWQFLLSTFLPVVMSCLVEGCSVDALAPGAGGHLRSLVILVGVLSVCPHMLPRGTGFRLGYVLSIVCWTDTFGFVMSMTLKRARHPPEARESLKSSAKHRSGSFHSILK